MLNKIRTYPIKVFVLTLFLTSCVQNQVTPSNIAPPSKPSIAPASQNLLSKLTTPKNGFEWHSYYGILFQTPKNWNENEKSINTGDIATVTYASSPEEFSESNMFEMGLTVQVIPESNKTLSIPAKKMAQIFLKSYLEPFIGPHRKEDVLMFEQKNIGNNIETAVLRYKDAPPLLTAIIVHKFIIANETEDAVYILTFESPESSWEDNWSKYGTPFLSKLAFVSSLQ